MTQITFDYDPAFEPPAPVVQIEVDGYHSSLSSRSLWAIVDSGADATMVPHYVLKAIGAAYKETMWMQGVTGGRLEVDLYLVRIRVGPHSIRGLHVVAAPDGNEAALGRDALNQLAIILDGPARLLEVLRGPE